MDDPSWWKVTFTIEVQTCTAAGAGPREAMDKAWNEARMASLSQAIPNTDMIKTGVVVDPTNFEGERLLS